MILKGRTIFGGQAEGISLVSTLPMSFYGGVDPKTGKVVERGSDLFGQCLKNKVLAFPNGKGSTVGSYILYRLRKEELAPCAIINSKCETIVAVGAIISNIPCVDSIEISKLKTGSRVIVRGDEVEVVEEGPSSG